MRYKVIKCFPNSPELGEILDFTKDDIVSDRYQRSWAIEDCSGYPEFWELLKPIKPKFKIGEIVAHENKIGTRVGVITEVHQVWDLPCYNYESTLFDRPVSGSNFRKASNEETIIYYKQQGWVKGAKFKHKEDCKVYIVENLKFRTDKQGIYIVFENNTYELPISYCELIKESEYPKSLKDIKRITGWYSNFDSEICFTKNELNETNVNLFTTENQVKSTLAFAQLSQLHKAMIAVYNKANNCDWKPDWNSDTFKWVIYRYSNQLLINVYEYRYCPLVFPTKELAEFSLLHHTALWKQYYELD